MLFTQKYFLLLRYLSIAVRTSFYEEKIHIFHLLVTSNKRRDC